jgi:hypothetical protein
MARSASYRQPQAPDLSELPQASQTYNCAGLSKSSSVASSTQNAVCQPIGLAMLTDYEKLLRQEEARLAMLARLAMFCDSFNQVSYLP